MAPSISDSPPPPAPLLDSPRPRQVPIAHGDVVINAAALARREGGTSLTLRSVLELFGPTFPGEFVRGDASLSSGGAAGVGAGAGGGGGAVAAAAAAAAAAGKAEGAAGADGVATSLYFISYRGISLGFPLPPGAVGAASRGSSLSSASSSSSSSYDVARLLAEYPDLQATRIFVYQGTDLLRPEIPGSSASTVVTLGWGGGDELPAASGQEEKAGGRGGLAGGLTGGYSDVAGFRAYVDYHNSNSNSGAQGGGQGGGLGGDAPPLRSVVCHGDSVQDVLSELGKPDEVSGKGQNKLDIHSGGGGGGGGGGSAGGAGGAGGGAVLSSSEGSDGGGGRGSILSAAAAAAVGAGGPGAAGGGGGGGAAAGGGGGSHCQDDYFFNYLSLGIDVMFDGVAHTVVKLVLHGNFPGHSDFNCWTRCHYRLLLPTTPAGGGGGVNAASAVAAAPASTSSKKGKSKGKGKGGGGQASSAPAAQQGGQQGGQLGGQQEGQHGETPQAFGEVDGGMGWEHVQRILGPGGQPMVHTGGGTVDYGTVASLFPVSPFGSTHLHAYPGCVFEVMPNGCIPTVTIFAPPLGEAGTQ
jgi:hypothetical protein